MALPSSPLPSSEPVALPERPVLPVPLRLPPTKVWMKSAPSASTSSAEPLAASPEPVSIAPEPVSISPEPVAASPTPENMSPKEAMVSSRVIIWVKSMVILSVLEVRVWKAMGIHRETG